MPNINFELNLNKHPKDVINRSLIDAHNVQLSNDLSCLHTEHSITENEYFKNVLRNKYVAGYISCNKELILFLAPSNYKTQFNNGAKQILINIYRFKEKGDNAINSFDNGEGRVCYTRFAWHGGELKGTFTYNIKSHLIIAVAESNTLTGDLIPVKTINLGNYEDTASDIDTDLMLNDDKLSFNPEIKIPSISEFNYVNGLSYKGWYTLFIRYKINSSDYTKWYHIGFPIFVDEIEQVQLFNYFLRNWNDEETSEKQNHDSNLLRYDKRKRGWGIRDYISSTSKTCNTTLNLIINHKTNNFEYYQLGVIISSKTEQLAFKTLDLSYNNSSEFFLNISSMEESSIEELTFNKYNYYDVKNIINYKNRLYFSNYKETDINSSVNLQAIANKLQAKIKKEQLSLFIENNSHFENLNIKFFIKYSIGGAIIYGPNELNFYENDLGVTKSTINNFVNTYVDSEYFSNGGIIILCAKLSYSDGSNEIIELGVISDINTYTPNHNTGHISGSYGLINLDSFNYDIYAPSLYVTLNVTGGTLTSINYVASVVIDNYQDVVVKNIINIKDTYHKRLKYSTLIPGDKYNLFVHFVNKYGENTDGIPLTDIVGDTGITIEHSSNSFIITNDNINIEQLITNDDSSFYIYNLEIIEKEELINCGFVGYFISYEKVQHIVKLNGYLTNYDFNQADLKYEVKRDNRKILAYDGYPANDKFIKYYNESVDGYKYRFYCLDVDLLDTIELNFNKLILKKGNCYDAEETNNKSNENVSVRDNTKTQKSFYNQNNSGTYPPYPKIEVYNKLGIIPGRYSITSDTDFDNSANITEDLFNYNNLTLDNSYLSFDIKSVSLVTAHSFNKNNQYRGSYIEIELDRKLPDNFKDYKASLLTENNNLYSTENKLLIKLSDVLDISSWENNVANKFNIIYGLNGHLTYNNVLVYNNNQVILNSAYNVLLNKNYQSYITSAMFTTTDSSGHIIKNDKIFNDTMICPVALISNVVYSDLIYEARCFKTVPEIYISRTEAISNKEEQTIFEFTNNIIVLPQNSIDLYIHNFSKYDSLAPISYINYKNHFIDSFDKRIVRSNPIADESFENNWRTVSPESYKDITENKGNITNLVALGTTFLVHTEHSLFMFDRDNTLKTGDDSAMQLSMPDVFDVDYKEVFASNLGSCGLQDKDAYIFDEFGYIFYDNDAHKFYKFNSKKITELNTSINEFINKYKPFKVRFANDSENNRILVDISYKNTRHIERNTLSFNTKIDKWISFHVYNFDRAFNTKQLLYLLIDESYTSLYTINNQGVVFENEESVRNGIYSVFENIKPEEEDEEEEIVETRNIDDNEQNNEEIETIEDEEEEEDENFYRSDISIIVNDKYEAIKTLESLTWKLYNIKRITNDYTEYKHTPREQIRTPYAGIMLRVYNDECDTGTIDIETFAYNKNTSVMNYKKPYWHLGNWNLNYLKNSKNLTNFIDDFRSRIHGNYFIIQIIFGKSYERIEFETLDCQLTINPTI